MESNTIRIIDLAFVAKDEDGSIAAFELSDLDPDVAALFGPTGAAAGGLFNERGPRGAQVRARAELLGRAPRCGRTSWASTLADARAGRR